MTIEKVAMVGHVDFPRTVKYYDLVYLWPFKININKID